MMPADAMRVAVVQLFGGRVAIFRNLNIEIQVHPCERVVAVNKDFLAEDIEDAEHGRAGLSVDFELQARFHVRPRWELAEFHIHFKRRVHLAIAIFGRQRDGLFLADGEGLHLFVEGRQYLSAPREIEHWVLANGAIEDFARIVLEGVVKSDDFGRYECHGAVLWISGLSLTKLFERKPCTLYFTKATYLTSSNIDFTFQTSIRKIETSYMLAFQNLETNADREETAKIILSCFIDRPFYSQESLETIIERIAENDDIFTSDGILRELKHLCLPVWQDDLCDGYAYNEMVRHLNEIGKNPIPIIEVKDGFHASEPGNDFILEIDAKGKKYQRTLRHGRTVDFNFLHAFNEAFLDSNSTGRYYVVASDIMDEGQTYVYLEPEEHAKITEKGVLSLCDFNEEYINSVEDVFFRPYKQPQIIGMSTSIPVEKSVEEHPENQNTIPLQPAHHAAGSKINSKYLFLITAMIALLAIFGFWIFT